MPVLQFPIDTGEREPRFVADGCLVKCGGKPIAYVFADADEKNIRTALRKSDLVAMQITQALNATYGTGEE